MSLNDPVANVMSHLLNCDKLGKKYCEVRPVSKIIKNILTILKDNGYIGNFSSEENKKGGFIKVELIGNINKCGVVKPRFSVTKNEYEKFEKRYLPAKNFGILIVSTSKGIFTHKEAIEKEIGGKLLVYCY